ncbi:MAG: M20 family metallopeptidase [Spirochaetes bacterium]|nr:M20 family metallopeptidase [Spirochaetota bacterium]
MSDSLMRIEKLLDTDEIVDLASALIAIESHRDAPGREIACAQKVAQVFSGWGMDAELVPVLDGRPNVYCVLKGSGGGSSLMLNGHLDTVPAYEMDFPPFEPRERDGYLYGRGTVDMKGPIACMMVALRLIRDAGISLKGDLIFTGVINEEDRSEGTEFLVRNGPRADRCVVGEPTSLAIMAGHRGLEWLEFEFSGIAAHGGTPEKGINAISMAARFIRRVEERLLPELARRIHPVIGPAVMNFGVIKGGTQPSSVADRCIVQVDRRWIPSERLERVLGEYEDIIAELASGDPGFRCTMKRMESNMATMDHYPMEIALDDPLVCNLRDALLELGMQPSTGAFGGWTDASLISNFAGIPTLVFGPGELSVAHSRAERVAIGELRTATLAYVLLALKICNLDPSLLPRKP